MAAITVNVSDEDVSAVEASPEEFARELLLAGALHWWSLGRISLARAASIAGLSYRQFLDEIAARKVTWPYGESDLEQDLKSLRLG